MVIMVFGLVLGISLGALGMWLYLMNRHAGRPIDWRAMAMTAAITFAVLGAMLGSRAYQ